ncbi:hypothetical protein [Oceanobacillus sp. Castelsardo]|uniref:DUF6115 domain-containing protein n=1 Tax=Oceanobacillus sp. Castelsardo TaxID=1851204 RepID=UPI000837AA72|nr:hypothetical protein [Oceanobacillus sp. Castelsardo]
MISFLLIISFLLHIISIYAIYMLNKQVQKKEDTTEIAQLFEEYLEEIKKENTRLKNDLKRYPHNKSDKPIEVQVDKKNKLVDSHIMEGSEKEWLKNVDKVNDSLESSLEAKVLQLYHQSLSVTDIAKKLDCGKTEAELIIRFHEKK